MIKCPNCSGKVKFNIEKQKVVCEFCKSEFSPYDLEKKEVIVDAEFDFLATSDEYFDVNLFTCEACGAEMITDDTDVTGVCRYCGSINIFKHRISRERKPKTIIPFKITKDECKQLYKKQIRHALYAPSELKNEEFIDSFRGVYIPYWMYNVSQDGEINFKGTHIYQDYHYEIIELYNVTAELNEKYYGIPFDASKIFYDNISEYIAPYNFIQSVNFTPAYLCGFYADTADVEQYVYIEDAMEKANQLTLEKIKSEYDHIQLKTDDLNKTFHTNAQSAYASMLPVWFMSYKKGNRIAYMTVNGQTGKVVADIPVDYKKFLIGTILVALPIFFMLNTFFTVLPSTLLWFVGIISSVAGIFYSQEKTDTYIKDNNIGDKGINSDEKIGKIKKTQYGDLLVMATFFVVIITNLLSGISPAAYSKIIMFGENKPAKVILLFVIILSLLYEVTNMVKYHSTFCIGNMCSLAGSIISFAVLFVKPVEDSIYYYAAVGTLGLVAILLIDLVNNYNKLSTRRLPHFNKTGGDDDNAK